MCSSDLPEAGPWDLWVGCNPVRRAQDHGRRERAGLFLEPLPHGVDSPMFLSELGTILFFGCPEVWVPPEADTES